MSRDRSGSSRYDKATVRNITLLLNRVLNVRKIKDAARNGLQVRSQNSGVITKVGFGVDADLATIERAASLGAGLLVVHHGIVWHPQKDRELVRKRSSVLEKRKVALYAAHLPLDLHAEYGNNMQLASLLGLGRVVKFGRYHGIDIGYAGVLKHAVAPEELASILNRALHTRCRMLAFGKERIRSVGIVSGGGGSALKEAVAKRLDCLLVGEIDLSEYNAARDHGINVIVAGHYATETVGVKALMPVVAEAFGVETVFVDEPKKW